MKDKKKLTLDELRMEAFSTPVNRDEQQQVRGGFDFGILHTIETNDMGHGFSWTVSEVRFQRKASRGQIKP